MRHKNFYFSARLLIYDLKTGAVLSNNDGRGVLDTKLGATPFRSLVNDGDAHLVLNCGVARFGKLVGQRGKYFC